MPIQTLLAEPFAGRAVCIVFKSFLLLVILPVILISGFRGLAL